MTDAPDPRPPAADLDLRHALLRSTDRAIGAEMSSNRRERELESLRAVLAETRGGLTRRDARLQEAAQRTQSLEADLEATRRQLSVSRAAQRQLELELELMRDTRTWRVGQALARPANRVTRWVGR